MTDKTAQFLQKLAPCIERSDLDACVEEAARVAREMDVGARELREFSGAAGMGGRHDFAYVLALAAQGHEGTAKAGAYYNAGLAAQSLRKVEKAEEHYILAIRLWT